MVDSLGDENIKIHRHSIEGMKIELMRKSIEASVTNMIGLNLRR